MTLDGDCFGRAWQGCGGQVTDVRIGDGKADVAPVTELGDGLQTFDVEPGDYRSTLIVAQDLARLIREVERNRCALLGADPENRNGDVARGVTRDVTDAFDAVGDHQNAPLGQPGVAQQRLRLGDGIVRLTAKHGHHLGRQGIQQIDHGAPIVGEGRHSVSVPGIRHQTDKAFVLQIQQVDDFVPRPHDSGRWRVIDQHRQR